MRLDAAISFWSSQNAAQIIMGVHTNVRGSLFITEGSHPPNTTCTTAKRNAITSTNSSTLLGLHTQSCFRLQTNSRGAIIRSPTASPSHHVTQTEPYFDQSA